MHAALGQAADAKDLTLVQFQIDVLQLIAFNAVNHLQHNLITVRAIVIGTVVVALQFAADHVLFDEIGIKFALCLIKICNDIAVAQNGQGVALFHQLVQIVRDEQNRSSLILQLLHLLVEEVTAGDYDLALVTCTYGGDTRLVVYCDVYEPER